MNDLLNRRFVAVVVIREIRIDAVQLHPAARLDAKLFDVFHSRFLSSHQTDVPGTILTHTVKIGINFAQDVFSISGVYWPRAAALLSFAR